MIIIQVIADLLHLTAILFLITKVYVHKNVIGISYKTQLLYLSVFLCRYMDLFTRDYSTFYLFFMKIFFILLTSYTLYLIRCKKQFSETYEKKDDRHPIWTIYLTGIILTFFIHSGTSFTELLWSYSIWIEAMTIIPQMNMKISHVSYRKVMKIYIFLLALYKFLYLILWGYKIVYDYPVHYCAVAGGILQLILYVDCVYKVRKPKK